MKKIILGFVLSCVINCYAQMITSGNGNIYTFAKLATEFAGNITENGNGDFHLSGDLTIAKNDTLLLDAATEKITIDENVTVIIEGALLSEARTGKLLISGANADSAATAFRLQFAHSAPSSISNVIFEYCDNIDIQQSEVLIDSCEFRFFNSQVIKYMSCNPIIQNCYFHDNKLAAINSAANITGSPIIRNNIFYHNVLDNVNQPQINLGPGTENDTIYIIDNVIDGCSNMSGGIAVADLMNVSHTNVVLRGNRIDNNRYGYTQNGTNIYAIIEDNIFKDNNLETNPMNGGSGISIYGNDTTCAAKLRRNLITGNFWGVTAIYYHNIDMGTADDFGYNSLYDNQNGGVEYALYNNAYSPMSAIGNYWGDNSAEHAEEVIFHQNDQNNLGLVTYEPVLYLEPDLLSCRAINGDNSQIIEGVFVTYQPYTYAMQYALPENEIFNPADWTFELDVPLGVDYELVQENTADDEISFERIYRLSTPHGTEQEWRIIFEITTSVSNYQNLDLQIYPNPATDQCRIVSSEPMTRITVVNALGQAVMSHAVSTQEHLLTGLDNLPKGLYYIVIQTVKEKNIRKVEIR